MTELFIATRRDYDEMAEFYRGNAQGQEMMPSLPVGQNLNALFEGAEGALSMVSFDVARYDLILSLVVKT